MVAPRDRSENVEDHADRRSDSMWHLDKKVNISHIIATLMLAAAIFAWGSKIEQRVALVEAGTSRQSNIDQTQDQEMRRYVVEIRQDIRDLSHKIDKLIESGGRK